MLCSFCFPRSERHDKAILRWTDHKDLLPLHQLEKVFPPLDVDVTPNFTMRRQEPGDDGRTLRPENCFLKEKKREEIFQRLSAAPTSCYKEVPPFQAPIDRLRDTRGMNEHMLRYMAASNVWPCETRQVLRKMAPEKTSEPRWVYSNSSSGVSFLPFECKVSHLFS